MNILDQLLKPSKRRKVVVAVAAAADEEVLAAISEASKLQIANFILYASKAKLDEILAKDSKLDITKCTIVDVATDEEACIQAVTAVHSNHAQVLMKGLVDTAVILKQVLNKEYGLRTDRILSHTMVLKLPKFDRPIYLTDGAMNIDPTPTQLKDIVNNAVSLAHSLGNEKPKVAIISAIEKVNPKMPSTLKADEVKKMYINQEITGCEIEGPLAIDLALDHEACKIKKMTSPVCGNADILVVPYIEVGNALYKGWVFGTDGVQGAGVVLGASAPIVLTSRSDSHTSKLYSIALACNLIK